MHEQRATCPNTFIAKFAAKHSSTIRLATASHEYVTKNVRICIGPAPTPKQSRPHKGTHAAPARTQRDAVVRTRWRLEAHPGALCTPPRGVTQCT